MTNDQKINNMNALFSKKYSPVSKMEAWMERWADEKVTSKAQISTFCFIWNQLSEFYRRKLMLFSYWSIFIMMIRWHINDTYFRQVFSTWRPMFIAPKFYERTLRVAASNITKGGKHQKVFNLLWKPVNNLYSDKNVAEFIWVCMPTLLFDLPLILFLTPSKFYFRARIHFLYFFSFAEIPYNLRRHRFGGFYNKQIRSTKKNTNYGIPQSNALLLQY